LTPEFGWTSMIGYTPIDLVDAEFLGFSEERTNNGAWQHMCQYATQVHPRFILEGNHITASSAVDNYHQLGELEIQTFTWDAVSGLARWYRNHQFNNSNAVLVSSITQNSNNFQIGPWKNTTVADGIISFVYLWRRALQPGEIRNLVRDPWQLVDGRRRALVLGHNFAVADGDMAAVARLSSAAVAVGELDGLLAGTAQISTLGAGLGELVGEIAGTAQVSSAAIAVGELDGVLEGRAQLSSLGSGLGELVGEIAGTAQVGSASIAVGELDGVLEGRAQLSSLGAALADLVAVAGQMEATSRLLLVSTALASAYGQMEGTSLAVLIASVDASAPTVLILRTVTLVDLAARLAELSAPTGRVVDLVDKKER
jgi:hypothetical protein